MRGVKRSAIHEPMVRRLTETATPSNRPVFPTIRELMCFAAVLGYEQGLKKPLQGETFEVDGRNFGNYQPAVDTLYLIALAGERNADILRDESENEMVSIFEQYAEGGFEILAGWLREKPDDEIGDRAILAALAKEGYLGAPRPVDSVMPDVKF